MRVDGITDLARAGFPVGRTSCDGVLAWEPATGCLHTGLCPQPQLVVLDAATPPEVTERAGRAALCPLCGDGIDVDLLSAAVKAVGVPVGGLRTPRRPWHRHRDARQLLDVEVRLRVARTRALPGWRAQYSEHADALAGALDGADALLAGARVRFADRWSAHEVSAGVTTGPEQYVLFPRVRDLIERPLAAAVAARRVVTGSDITWWVGALPGHTGPRTWRDDAPHDGEAQVLAEGDDPVPAAAWALFADAYDPEQTLDPVALLAAARTAVT